MKRKLLFCIVLFCAGFQLGFGQYVVNFEGAGEGIKNAYASGTVNLSGLNWDFAEALTQTTDPNDWKNGNRSARSRGYGTSAMTMLQNKTNGLGTVSFEYRSFGTDTQVAHMVEYSVDSGASWIQVGSNFTGTATPQIFSETINITGNVRIRIRTVSATGTTNRRLNIDDIIFTDFTVVSDPNLNITGTNSHGSACLSNPATSIEYTINNTGTVQADDLIVTSNNPQFVISGLSSSTIAPSGSATFNVTFTPTAVGVQNATLTVSSSTATSNSPNVNITGNGLSVPIITTQPANQNRDIPATANFTVNSSNATSYQWQVSTNGGTTWNNVTGGSGATTNSYTTGATSEPMSGNLYRCVITNPCGASASNTALLTLTNSAPSNAQNLSGCFNDTSVVLTWNNPATPPTGGYVIFAIEGTTEPTAPPNDANTYTANANFNAAPFEIPASLGKVIYKGNGTTATVTGLTEDSTYSFRIFAYNGETLTGWSNGTSGGSNLEGIAQGDVRNLVATPNTNQINLNWNNPTPTSCWDQLIIVANQGTVIFTPIGDGSDYSGADNDNYTAPNQLVYETTANVTNKAIFGLMNGTNYCFKVFIRRGSTWSEGVEVCATPTLTYCDSFGNTSFATGIRNVTFNTINNNTVIENNDYSDFTAISTSVNVGESYDLSVNVNTDGEFTTYTRVWFDWNRDGVFTDASEGYDLGTAFDETNVLTSESPLNIQVPSNAIIGVTRMRVSTRYNTPPTPCATGFDGEVEDYSINIVRPAGSRIFVKGNNNTINNGDTSTSGLNNTAFGASNIGVPDTNVFVIESIGTNTLSLGAPAIEISGTNASDFAVTSAPSATINSGAQSNFEITFTPSESGPRTAIVTIYSNDNNNNDVFTFVVNGIGNGSEINVQGNSISIPSGSGIPELSVNNFTLFGNSNINSAELITRSFDIQNLGNQTLTVSNITLSGPDAADFNIASPTALTIAGGASASLVIEFLPLTTGNKDAVVTINHNDSTGGENPYNFSIRGVGVDFIVCTNDELQTIAIQDFEVTPATPTWSYTNTQTYASTVAVTGGTGYGAFGDGGNSNLYLDGRSFQLNNNVNDQWAYAYLTFNSVNTQNYDDVELSLRVGAFSNDSGNRGLDSDDVIVSISEDNGTTWSDEVRVTGYINSRWSFVSGTGVASVVYDNNNTIENSFTPSVSGFQTTEGYSTIRVTNLPSVSDLMVRITLKNNRFDEIWAIDNVTLTGKVPTLKTWDGFDWRDVSNNITTAPTSSQKAVFSGNYSTATDGGNIEACECEVNNDVNLSITDGYYMRIQNDIINNGTINVSSQGSLVQVNDSGLITLNSPNARNILSKFTSPLQNWYDYTYWSSPLESVQIENALFTANVNRRFIFRANLFVDLQIEDANTGNFSPGQDDIDDNGNDWFNQQTGSMVPGVGYAATHSASVFTPNTSYQYIFEGTLASGGAFNNGPIDVDIYIDPPTTVPYNNWNFIGNPYPSAISAQRFFEETASILEGVIYLWSHSTDADPNSSGNQNMNFSQNDYAIINYTGSVAGEASDSGSDIPNGYIASGQGFFVIGKKSYAGSPGFYREPIFNNSMRVIDNNDQFFRNSEVFQPNKLWLNLTSDNGAFNQILIGYIEGATNSIDNRSFDAPRNMAVPTFASLYSTIENSDKPFAIQGKDPNSLDYNEVITLGFSNSIDVATLYTISIAQFQGAFMSSETIYLKDNLLNRWHDLKASDYNFTSEVGTFNTRFEIVFNRESLSVNDALLSPQSLSIIELSNGEVQFSVADNHRIKTIDIIDLQGRTIYRLKGDSNLETYNLSQLSSAAYVAKVTLASGQTIHKKALKRL